MIPVWCVLLVCQVLGDIKHCILATDLALFFGNRAKLKDLVDQEQFDWKSKEHRYLSFDTVSLRQPRNTLVNETCAM